MIRISNFLLALLFFSNSALAGQAVSELAVARNHPGLAAWDAAHPGWRATWNEQTQTPRLLYGPSFEVASPNTDLLGPDALTPSALAPIAVALGIAPSELHWVDARRVRDKVVIRFEQRWAGHSLLDSRIQLTVHVDGRLMAVSCRGLHHSAAARAGWPTDADGFNAEASVSTLESAGSPPPLIGDQRQGWLITSGELRPAHEVAVQGLAPEGSAILRFDATTGELLERHGLRAHGGVSGTVAGDGVAGWDPDRPGSRRLVFPLRHLEVEAGGATAWTDAQGDFELPLANPSLLTASLSGPFASVIDDGAPELNLSLPVSPGADVNLVFNETPSSAGTGQVHAFQHVNLCHDWITGILNDPPFTDMDFPLQVRMAAPSAGSCNAFYDANVPELRFFAPGGGCPHTSYASLIYHEYQHAVTFEILGPSPTYLVSPLSEALSDTSSVLLTGDRFIARDFWAPGEPLRDAEFDRVYPVLGTLHIRGLPVVGSYWDLRTRLLHESDLATAAPLAGQLFLDSLFFDPGPTAIGPEIVTAVLLADDDDGDLGNGTPHEEAIVEAFAVHGLSLGSPGLPPLRELTDDLVGRTANFEWILETTYDDILVEKDGAPVTTLPGDATGWQDPDVSPGIHTYAFRAVSGSDVAPAVMRWLRNRNFLRGDVNGDGAIGLDDAIGLLGFVFLGQELTSCPDAADVDDTGGFNLVDAVLLLNFLFADGAPPLAPYPLEGLDPSADFVPCGDEL